MWHQRGQRVFQVAGVRVVEFHDLVAAEQIGVNHRVGEKHVGALESRTEQDLDDAVRGKVMALWIMGFGGTVPFATSQA